MMCVFSAPGLPTCVRSAPRKWGGGLHPLEVGCAGKGVGSSLSFNNFFA